MNAGEVLVAITAQYFPVPFPDGSSLTPAPSGVDSVRRISTGEIITFEEVSYDPAWTTYTDEYEWVT